MAAAAASRTPGDQALFPTLPSELICNILELLDPPDLAKFALTCRWGYDQAIPQLWKDLELKDCWTLHPRNTRLQLASLRCETEDSDEHDDTPIVKKLLVIAQVNLRRNPFVASKVQTVLHRCHLPTPNIFTELPHISFEAPALSRDVRTQKLLRMAIWNMTNVHTLRIIFGHYHLTYGLLYGFLHPQRPREVPLRKLWLESCSLACPVPGPAGMIFPDLSGLESIRLRRLSYLDHTFTPMRSALARGKAEIPGLQTTSQQLYNGIGGEYKTTLTEGWFYEKPIWQELVDSEDACRFDDIIYDSIPGAERAIYKVSHEDSPPMPPSEKALPSFFLSILLRNSSFTLASLNLDWLLTWTGRTEAMAPEIYQILRFLSVSRFPNLRAFQLRNAATTEYTKVPEDVYLLDEAESEGSDDERRPVKFLSFMEAHPNLQCLAWPMCRFFSHSKPHPDVAARADRVVANLSRTLTELRVDSQFSRHVEKRTDESSHGEALNLRTRRRRFISEFAARMTRLEIIKMEGGIPLDEKRETVRALHRCQLKKVVMIGVSCPIGNTWGNQNDFHTWPLWMQQGWTLENEDLAALTSTSKSALTPPGPDFVFTPQYGWPASSVMTHTLASLHAPSITELKFCGYNGAPIIFAPTGLADALLRPLRHFDNLKELVLSMWMLTFFDGSDRDQEPSSTALALLDLPDPDLPEETNTDADGFYSSSSSSAASDDGAAPVQTQTQTQTQAHAPLLHNHQHHHHHQHNQHNAPPPPAHLISITGDPLNGPEPVLALAPLSWPQRLEAHFRPQALAAQVVRQVGPHLSEVAKGRVGGVRVRASFCLNGDIFDLDVRVGKEVVGPCEEGERERWWGKLRGRRWF
ncbi:uncharacterized protein K452DRAFT_348888 [Aplosporella prunicola CBS 121167]|uniref:F-box domain-containing protein n=1 Tax=Aplosporella prunicola CBS 121167 TaxID=1176127 RepID=A0A6A6BQH6_9PEZI|nr:uncharacterized protein K452DRAFT_348888 [Aplosporella prunicola CBS 121167]KAF2146346.1 hypothetical protein K452DRAFT_348888 [Aplosporella prunicola CBS 121167]